MVIEDVISGTQLLLLLDAVTMWPEMTRGRTLMGRDMGTKPEDWLSKGSLALGLGRTKLQ